MEVWQYHSGSQPSGVVEFILSNFFDLEEVEHSRTKHYVADSLARSDDELNRKIEELVDHHYYSMTVYLFNAIQEAGLSINHLFKEAGKRGEKLGKIVFSKPLILSGTDVSPFVPCFFLRKNDYEGGADIESEFNFAIEIYKEKFNEH